MSFFPRLRRGHAAVRPEKLDAKTRQAKEVGKLVKTWARANVTLLDAPVWYWPSQRMLDSANTWMEGGCAMLAGALHRILPSSTIVAIVMLRQWYWRPQHFAVAWKGYVIDADGAVLKSTYLRRWRRLEHIDVPESQVDLVPATPRLRAEANLRGIVYNAAMVDRIEASLRDALANTSTLSA